MNPLAEIIAIAKMNLAVWRQHVDSDDGTDLGHGWLSPLSPTATLSRFPTATDGPVVYPSIEMAGLAGMYRWVLGQEDLDVVYANDLAYEVRGIDAVTKRKDSETFVLVEARGTTRPLRTPPAYLRKTKTRGRQLSWDWCWNATIDLAEFPTTAAAFLALYGPMILGRAERLLVVTQVKRVEDGYSAGETIVWDETALRRYPWLARERDWEQQRRWLRDLGEGDG